MTPVPMTRGLRTLRRKRWFLWGLLLGYLPVIWLSLELTGSDRATGVVFALWICLVFIAVMVAAYATCPACGKNFHLHGVMPLWVRHCVHCGQPLSLKGKEPHTPAKNSPGAGP